MGGLETERRAVEEPSASLGPFDPEPVHRGHQPEHAPDPAKGGLRRGFLVDAQLAGLARLGPCLQLVGLVERAQDCSNLPSQRLGPAGQVIGGRPAQPATGRKQ